MSLGAPRRGRRRPCMGLNTATWGVLLGAMVAQGLAVAWAMIWVTGSSLIEIKAEQQLQSRDMQSMRQTLERYDNSREASAATQERLAGVIRELNTVVERLNAIERGGHASQQNQPGVGLGLPITQAIVQILGGELVLDSRPGDGSRFKVTLMLGEVAGKIGDSSPSRAIVGYDGPADAETQQHWLDVAWRQLQREDRSLVDRMEAYQIGTETVADVVTAAARRVLRNPDGNESEDRPIVDYRESWKKSDATEDIYFTAAELRRLLPDEAAILTGWSGSLRYC